MLPVVEKPIAAPKRYNYVRACIQYNLAKKRGKRQARMSQEKEELAVKLKEEMAARETRQPFPTLDVNAQV